MARSLQPAQEEKYKERRSKKKEQNKEKVPNSTAITFTRQDNTSITLTFL